MIFGMYLKNIEDISKSHKIINILNSRLIDNVVLLDNQPKPGTIKNIFKCLNNKSFF